MIANYEKLRFGPYRSHTSGGMVVLATVFGAVAIEQFHERNEALAWTASVFGVFFLMLASSVFSHYIVVTETGISNGGLAIGMIPRRGKERSFKEYVKVEPLRGNESLHLSRFVLLRVYYSNGQRPRGLISVSRRIVAPPGDPTALLYDDLLKVLTEKIGANVE